MIASAVDGANKFSGISHGRRVCRTSRIRGPMGSDRRYPPIPLKLGAPFLAPIFAYPRIGMSRNPSGEDNEARAAFPTQQFTSGAPAGTQQAIPLEGA
ncbi:hypothetical protein VCV18_007573 [Metarhizium anisopliae]